MQVSNPLQLHSANEGKETSVVPMDLTDAQ
jgi:hypothetical protein